MATIELVGKILLRHFEGDSSKVKELGRGCKAIGFPIAENLDKVVTIEGTKISFTPHFILLITYSDLGILGKLADSLESMKQQ